MFKRMMFKRMMHYSNISPLELFPALSLVHLHYLGIGTKLSPPPPPPPPTRYGVTLTASSLGTDLLRDRLK